MTNSGSCPGYEAARTSAGRPSSRWSVWTAPTDSLLLLRKLPFFDQRLRILSQLIPDTGR